MAVICFTLVLWSITAKKLKILQDSVMVQSFEKS